MATSRERDPSRTTPIQNKVVASINRSFANIERGIKQAFTEHNIFHIGGEPSTFAFNAHSDPEKVVEFEEWLTLQVDSGTLEIDDAGRVTFMDPEVNAAFQQGRQRAVVELGASGATLLPPSILGTGAQTEQLALIFQQVTNSFAAMSATMINTMTSTFSRGLIAGLSTTEMARVLEAELDLPRARSRTIARTEIVRAHHLGNVTELEAANIEGVTVVAEFSTAKDGRVCQDCARLEGRIFTVEEIRGVIPVHPNCRCVAIPVIPGVTEVEGKPTQRQLEDIVSEDSLTKDGKLKPVRGFFEEQRKGNPPPFSIPDAERRQEEENEQRLNFAIKSAKLAAKVKKVDSMSKDEIAAVMAEMIEFNANSIDLIEESIYRKINERVSNELLPLCIPGEDGESIKGEKGDSVQGKRGLTIKGNKGDSIQGKRGPRGYRGTSIKGNKGDNTKGDKGDSIKGDQGDLGPMPSHQFLTNKNDKVIGLRFEEPGGEWGKWIRFNTRLRVNNVQDLQIVGRKIRFLVNGVWTEFIKFGGGRGIGTLQSVTDKGNTTTNDIIQLDGKIIAPEFESSGGSFELSQKVKFTAFGTLFSVSDTLLTEKYLNLKIPYDDDGTSQIITPILDSKITIISQPIFTDVYEQAVLIQGIFTGTADFITDKLIYRFQDAGKAIKLRTIANNGEDTFDLFGTSADPFIKFTSKEGLTEVILDNAVPSLAGIEYAAILQTEDGSPLNVLGDDGGEAHTTPFGNTQAAIFSPYLEAETFPSSEDDLRATNSVYDPSVPGNWDDPDPTNVQEALDIIAANDKDKKSAIDNTLSATTSSIYQTKLTLSTGTRSGNYKILWTVTLNSNISVGQVRLQNVTDTITIGEQIWSPRRNQQKEMITGFDKITLDGVSKDFSIQWKSESGNHSQTVRDARIMIERWEE